MPRTRHHLRRADQERFGAFPARWQIAGLSQPLRRKRVGGADEGSAAQDCYVNVLRDAMCVDALDSCGFYFGTTGGQVYGSSDGGDTWNAIVGIFPRSYRWKHRPCEQEIPSLACGGKKSQSPVNPTNKSQRRDSCARVLFVGIFPRLDLKVYLDLDLGFGICLPLIRTFSPHHLRTLARDGDEVQLDLNGSATVQSVLDALEAKYPMLRGTIRDHGTPKRRPMVRFFVCGEDVSHDPVETALPEPVLKARTVIIMGAIAGG